MTFDFGFIGWCNEENHDKIWGYFLRLTPERQFNPWLGNYNKNCCIFWGRRGKAMQFKAGKTNYDLEKLVDSKIKKGYKPINQDKLIEIWPTFVEDAEGKLIIELLAGNVK